MILVYFFLSFAFVEHGILDRSDRDQGGEIEDCHAKANVTIIVGQKDRHISYIIESTALSIVSWLKRRALQLGLQEKDYFIPIGGVMYQVV